jgi:hypothetical protein
MVASFSGLLSLACADSAENSRFVCLAALASPIYDLASDQVAGYRAQESLLRTRGLSLPIPWAR